MRLEVVEVLFNPSFVWCCLLLSFFIFFVPSPPFLCLFSQRILPRSHMCRCAAVWSLFLSLLTLFSFALLLL